jgi:hypothetical protein
MVSQVVLSPSADGGPGLRIGPVLGGGESPTPKGSELHLGSQDLVRLANFASAHGFVVASFMLADAYLVPLSEDEQAQISGEMIERLKSFGGDELETAMQEDYEGLYVVGVNLIAFQSGMRISIRRRGYVETSIIHEAELLLESAWRELHLS